MELRKDPITRSWVVLSEGEAVAEHSSQCAYCMEPEAAPVRPILSLPMDGRRGGLRVFPHPAPLYRIEEGSADRRADGIYDRMRNLGAHEIIVEGLEHDRALSGASENEIAALLQCWALRISDLKHDQRFRYVTVFRNCGELSGQQIRHPHSEVTATAFIPRRILYELRAAQEHFQLKERCVFCDIVRQEERHNLRVVELTPRYLAVYPFASRVPYEMWILPRYHHSSFEDDLIRHPEHSELAAVLRRAVARLEQITEHYHLVLHTSPNTRTRTELNNYWTTIEDDYHWHLEILPITEKRSKSYSIKEVYYCAMLPEAAAARLRDLPTAPAPLAQAHLAFQSP